MDDRGLVEVCAALSEARRSIAAGRTAPLAALPALLAAGSARRRVSHGHETFNLCNGGCRWCGHRDGRRGRQCVEPGPRAGPGGHSGAIRPADRARRRAALRQRDGLLAHRGLRRPQQNADGGVRERRPADGGGPAVDSPGQAAAAAPYPRARHLAWLPALVDSAGRQDGGGDGQEDGRVDDRHHVRGLGHQRRDALPLRCDLPVEHDRHVPR